MKEILDYLNELNDEQLIILSIMLIAILRERNNKGVDNNDKTRKETIKKYY